MAHVSTISGKARLTRAHARIGEVMLVVSIPSSKLRFRHHIGIFDGATVSDALESTYDVKHGVVCCDSRDIWAVNGLASDPYKQKWWIIKINGNTQNVSSTAKLKNGDVVELEYKEDAFYPVAHVRLEEWVAKAYDHTK